MNKYRLYLDFLLELAFCFCFSSLARFLCVTFHSFSISFLAMSGWQKKKSSHLLRPHKVGLGLRRPGKHWYLGFGRGLPLCWCVENRLRLLCVILIIRGLVLLWKLLWGGIGSYRSSNDYWKVRVVFSGPYLFLSLSVVRPAELSVVAERFGLLRTRRIVHLRNPQRCSKSQPAPPIHPFLFWRRFVLYQIPRDQLFFVFWLQVKGTLPASFFSVPSWRMRGI